MSIAVRRQGNQERVIAPDFRSVIAAGVNVRKWLRVAVSGFMKFAILEIAAIGSTSVEIHHPSTKPRFGRECTETGR